MKARIKQVIQAAVMAAFIVLDLFFFSYSQHLLYLVIGIVLALVLAFVIYRFYRGRRMVLLTSWCYLIIAAVMFILRQEFSIWTLGQSAVALLILGQIIYYIFKGNKSMEK